MNSNQSANKTGIADRFKQEMREYLAISLYLWVCFSVLLLFKVALLEADGIKLVPIGTAAVKALILGKFILIGKAINIGRRMNPRVLLQRIAWKSATMLILLMLLKAIEELIVGLAHGHPATVVMTEFMARGWLQNIAPGVVMLLVLIPLIAYEELDKAMGKGSLKRMLFERRQES